MDEQETRKQAEARMAANRHQTVEEFRAWMVECGMILVPCDPSACDYSACKGWRLKHKDTPDHW